MFLSSKLYVFATAMSREQCHPRSHDSHAATQPDAKPDPAYNDYDDMCACHPIPIVVRAGAVLELVRTDTLIPADDALPE